MKVTVFYKSGQYDEFDDVVSVEVSLGPARQKLSIDEIKNLHLFSTSRDIYVFNNESHLIERNSVKRLTVSD